jgi:hypothetical protein
LFQAVQPIIYDSWNPLTHLEVGWLHAGARWQEGHFVVSRAELLAQTGTDLHRLDHVSGPVDRSEVLRYLGYPVGVEPNPQLQTILDDWVVEASRRASPRAVYMVLPVIQLRPRSLRLQTLADEVEFHGAIGEFLGASECVAPFIATAGPDVERLASELRQQGDDLAALIVNAVGAERAEAAEAMVIERLRGQAQRWSFAPTLPYSPGYCGMALTEQRTLFSLFGDHDVGVTLTDSCLMRPLKSVSGLIGLGPADRVAAIGSPCDRCELYNCAMRR